MKEKEFKERFGVEVEPNYIPQGDEVKIFTAAFESKIPMILKGPTGCGKTRFVQYMAHRLRVPLVTVSCHEDLTAADLVGRFLFKDDQTVWQPDPGPRPVSARRCAMPDSAWRRWRPRSGLSYS